MIKTKSVKNPEIERLIKSAKFVIGAIESKITKLFPRRSYVYLWDKDRQGYIEYNVIDVDRDTVICNDEKHADSPHEIRYDLLSSTLPPKSRVIGSMGGLLLPDGKNGDIYYSVFDPQRSKTK